MLPKYVTLFRAEGVKHTDRWGHFQKHPGASTIRMLRHNAHLCRHRANCVQGQDRWKDPCTAQLSQHEVFLSLIFPHFRAPLPLLFCVSAPISFKSVLTAPSSTIHRPLQNYSARSQAYTSWLQRNTEQQRWWQAISQRSYCSWVTLFHLCKFNPAQGIFHSQKLN